MNGKKMAMRCNRSWTHGYGEKCGTRYKYPGRRGQQDGNEENRGEDSQRNGRKKQQEWD